MNLIICNKKSWLIFLVFFLFISSHAFSYQDAYQSSQNSYESQREAQKNRQRRLISEHVNKVVLNTYLNKSRETVLKIIERSNIGFLPQIAFLAVQQISEQAFKQKPIKDTMKSTYVSIFDESMSKIENGESQNAIQDYIISEAEKNIYPIFDDRVFKYVVEEVIKQSHIQQQKMMYMQAAQRQAQLAAVQQRYQAIQKAMIEQYMKAMQINMQHQQAAYQQAYEQSILQSMSNY